MLELRSIYKGYVTGGFTQVALNNVSVAFRNNEFVAILGPSGSGKTTLLNIVGGLDHYDAGDLIIEGVSTRQYTDRDWDTYRNNRVGFVFQNYNLIPHQSVLANVELAMTLAGVSRAERRKRALEALEKVGLKEHANKRPNQMSGGQMQRVAIARALVNNPEIVLADEPTGALDSKTSVQIMELLTEIAKDRLVVMVTHNAELANEYATRIVNLTDGVITSDTNPYHPEAEKESFGSRVKHTAMSFFTALSLSFNNLMTKKGRTIMTAFAGSIGIIGIALILALANGVNTYIESVEEDTLSEYPLSIESSGFDLTSLMALSSDSLITDSGEEASENTIKIAKIISNMLSSLSSNDLASFKEYIDENYDSIAEYVKSVEYSYGVEPQIFDARTEDEVYQVNPDNSLSTFGMGSSVYGSSYLSSYASTNIFHELPSEASLYEEQYDVLAGRWPSASDELVLVLPSEHLMTDYMMYSLGLRDRSEYTELIAKFAAGEDIDAATYTDTFTYEEVMALEYKLVNVADFYVYDETYNVWIDKTDDSDYMKNLVDNGQTLKIVGIVTANDGTNASMLQSGLYYTTSLSDQVVEAAKASDIVKQQIANPDVDVFSGKPFESEEGEEGQTGSEFSMASLFTIDQELMAQAFSFNPLTMQMEVDEEKMAAAFKLNVSQEELTELMMSLMTDDTASYESNLSKLGYVDMSKPASIDIYPLNFEAKEAVIDFLDEYNSKMRAADEDDKVISYSDIVGTLMTSVTDIVDTISTVLVAFVAISLVVSSIMIGIITYISVLERRKEIGILRAIGASKRDIRRVFNAETFIVGLVAGLLGVGITWLLCIPANAIIYALTSVANVAILPLNAAGILVLISVFLTFIAGLIPSSAASRKDPVEALRSE